MLGGGLLETVGVRCIDIDVVVLILFMYGEYSVKTNWYL